MASKLLECLKDPKALANKGFVARLADSLLEVIGKNNDRIKALDARISGIEAAFTKTLADSYKGPHLLNARHARGDLVTRGGSLWLALDATTETPGHCQEWKMIAKGGAE